VVSEVVILTIRGGDPAALVAAARNAVSQGRAQSGSVNVPAGPRDREVVAAMDTETVVESMVVLRGAGDDLIFDLELPPGARLVGAYRAHELVRRDFERTWPAGEPSPGLSLVCLVQRNPELTWQAYSDHWRDKHGPLALRRQPGFRRYVQYHVLERLTPDSPVADGIGELHFRTARAVMDEMFDSPEGMAEIMEDSRSFMSHQQSTTLPTTHWILG
jgi:uncharacterized protein (TIGR02118 family)